ncbi:hypothetical protein F2Q69_00019133 [Brassica cretica]|uniref:F-box domain-containing protein n=1 Tax=Brassica cretica TaxID=69181 RepID=A0A8S9Q6N5_BRACR|nr:hypothetical protein F2Q69_00019133 [Brassica cretica]
MAETERSLADDREVIGGHVTGSETKSPWKTAAPPTEPADAPLSDLPRDVEEEVLCRVPMTSLRPVRSTCKRWNSLSRCELFAKKHLAHHQAAEAEEEEDPLVVVMIDYKVGLMRLKLSNEEDIVKPEARLTGLDQMEVCEIFHSEGLLLCIPRDHSRLVVWNPYWGRPRWIEHTHNHHKLEKHLYGRLNRYTYGLGYDTSRSYKVLRFIDYPPYFVEFKIYDLISDSWRNIILDPRREWRISGFGQERGISIKGNTYWFASSETSNSFLVCFDFTRETFWSPLPLPFEAFPDQDGLSLSSTDEKLVVLFQRCDTLTMEIWISTAIEQPSAVSWNAKVFLSANIKQLVEPTWMFRPSACFFIDEEKKLVVVFDKNTHLGDPTHEVAYIFGLDGSLKQAIVRESSYRLCESRVCCYVPSLLHLN